MVCYLLFLNYYNETKYNNNLKLYLKYNKIYFLFIKY